MLTGKDFLHRLNYLPFLIKKYSKTEDVKYLKQAYQIINDTLPKIRDFKKIINRKLEILRKEKNGI